MNLLVLAVFTAFSLISQVHSQSSRFELPQRRSFQLPPKAVNSFQQVISQDPIPKRDFVPPIYKRWEGPLHVPVIGPFGVPTEPPEVEVERYQQLVALKDAYATAEPERDYDKAWDGIGEETEPSSNSQFQHRPYIQPSQHQHENVQSRLQAPSFDRF